MTKHEYMHEERAAAREIIERIGAIDFIEGVVQLDNQNADLLARLAAETQLRHEAEISAEFSALRIDQIKARCLDLATDLSRVGGFDHKAKNEAILTVVNALLMMARWQSHPKDDVPF